MTIRHFVFATLLLGAFLRGTAVHAAPPAAAKPNIVVMIADDLTYRDLGCWGNKDVKTPNLDRLAGQGMRLTRCYTTAPVCSPTRQSLYTGLYPVKSGAYPNHAVVKNGVQSLPHYLKPLGYRVGLVGKRHFGPAASFPFEYPPNPMVRLLTTRAGTPSVPSTTTRRSASCGATRRSRTAWWSRRTSRTAPGIWATRAPTTPIH